MCTCITMGSCQCCLIILPSLLFLRPLSFPSPTALPLPPHPLSTVQETSIAAIEEKIGCGQVEELVDQVCEGVRE